MTEYTLTINWPKWVQALRIVTTMIVLSLLLLIMYFIVDGRGFSKGKQVGFTFGITQCPKIEATFLP